MNFKIKNANAAVTAVVCVSLAVLGLTNFGFIVTFLLAAFGAFKFYEGVEIYDIGKREKNKKAYTAE